MTELIKEIERLTETGRKILESAGKDDNFAIDYQIWYTATLEYVRQLCPNRFSEFESCYSKASCKNSLSIKEYMLGVSRAGVNSIRCVKNSMNLQVAILAVIPAQIKSKIQYLKESLTAQINETELDTARKLLKVNIRASGCIAGIVLETHLKNLLRKYHPENTIKDKDLNINVLNEALRDVYGDITWREIQVLGDIRNYCDHNKRDANNITIEPTKAQVQKLINETKEFIKNHQI